VTGLKLAVLLAIMVTPATGPYHPSVDPVVLNNFTDKYNRYTAKLENGIIDLEAKREAVKAWHKTRMEEE
jgi:hypothetical protein